MTNAKKRRSADMGARYLTSIALAITFACPVYAASAAGTVTQLAGVLSARKGDGVVKILALQSSVDAGDLLATGASTYAKLKFSDGGELTLRPNTQIKIDDYKFDQAKPQEDNAFFRLLKGGLRAVTGLVGKRNGLDNYRMATPTATIGIRGTNYGLLYCEQDAHDCDSYRDNAGGVPSQGLYLDVAQGVITATNLAGKQEYAAGQFGYVASDKVMPVAISATNGVPISTDKGTNTPPESVLEKQKNPKDFECTVE